MEEFAIRTDKLEKIYSSSFEKIVALKKVSIDIKRGEFVTIMGPSGAGKTTLMNLIGCLDKTTAGTLKIADTNVTSLRENDLIQIRRENIGFVFQQFYLIPTLTVSENIELPLIFSKKAINQGKISDLLEEVGLKGKERIQLKYLSGGDKQCTGIARALVNEPRVIIADEPTGKLETKVREKILGFF